MCTQGSGGVNSVAPGMCIITSSHSTFSSKYPSSVPYFLLQSQAKVSDDEGAEPIQLGKWTLDAIIEGVVAKQRESPPEK